MASKPKEYSGLPNWSRLMPADLTCLYVGWSKTGFLGRVPATRFSEELLKEAPGPKSGRDGEPSARPDKPFAERVREAVETGADLGWVMRHFHLTREELRDYCPESVEDDGFSGYENRSGVTGY